MNKNIYFRIILYTVAAIFSVYIGFQINQQIQPSLNSIPKIDRSKAVENARKFMARNGFKREDFYEYCYYAVDNKATNYLIKQIGLNGVRKIFENETFPLSFWIIDYLRNVPRDQEEESISVRISNTGMISGFFHQLPDSLSADKVQKETAYNIALKYLKNWPGIIINDFSLSESNHEIKAKRSESNFTFEKPLQGVTQGEEVIKIFLSGSRVEGLHHYFNKPQTASAGVVGGANIIFNSSSIIIFFIVTILGLMVFLRLYHDGLIAVTEAAWAGVVLLVLLVIDIANSWGGWSVGTGLGNISRVNTKIIMVGVYLLIPYVYMFINTFTSWSAGDYLVRIYKSSLLSGLDSIINKRFISKNIGREVPVGIAYGAVTFGLLAIVGYLFVHFFNVQPKLSGEAGRDYSVFVPFVSIIISMLAFVLYDELIFRKFFISYLKNLKLSISTAIIISAFTYAFFNIFFNSAYEYDPGFYSLIPYFILGLIQGWVFWNYGLLASMTSGAVYTFLIKSETFLAPGTGFFTINVFVVAAILAGILAIGMFGIIRGKNFEYTHNAEPAHIRRIKEQTRMQKELEIARRVQLGLLPKEQPIVNGFDISGICVPALEVGGDYFDFIQLHDGKLGIAIADVSGKGVPAAIYMTLTKGILQSHAETAVSPKDVLSKVNSLMYRTIERSWYVSMFYAILDPTSKKLIFSRAGHNPAIVLNHDKDKPLLLQPSGIGLGLEMGDIFTKTLVEGEMQLQSGNTLIFYTDGFTEAMNEQEDEYTEERFLEFLNKNDNSSANDLIKKSIKEIKRFAGNADQHDDMTMVILKVY